MLDCAPIPYICLEYLKVVVMTAVSKAVLSIKEVIYYLDLVSFGK